MEIEGHLLNAEYITEYGEPVIRLWIKQKNKITVGYYRDFEPYFYAIPKDEADIQKLKKQILEIEGERYDEVIKPKKVETEKRFDKGEKTKVLKITTNHPQHVPTLREEISNLKEVSEYREADIPFINRFVIDKGLIPSSKIILKGKKTESEYTEKAIEINSLKGVFEEETPELKKLTFDCEMHNKERSPDPEKDPIIIISLVTPDGNSKLLTSDNGGDKELIQKFLKEIKKWDPDVILTYNGDDFDWPYLKDRAEKHNIKLEIGRDKSTPDFRGGARKTVSIKGRLNIDLYRIASRDLGEVKVKSLEEVADYLNVMNSTNRTDIPGHRVGEYWDDKEKRKKLLKYAREDAVSTAGVGEELLPNQLEFSKLTKQFADDISKMGRGRQVEWYLISKAHEQKELVPNRTGYRSGSNTYLGGFVLEPEKGLHENVISLDFSSMYPSLMISYNISPDTYIPPDQTEKHQDYHKAPEVEHRFRKDREGFFTEILEELLNHRAKIKKEIKNAKTKEETKSLKVREKAIKTLTNSFYGYTGWGAARWYKKECAEATTAWGREMINQAIQTAQKKNLKVIYGDTDSIFIKTTKQNSKNINKIAQKLAKQLNQTLPLEIEIEKHYQTIFFTEKKKRYAGLDQNNEIYIRGLEVRRGDWCDLAREMQQKVIEIILKDKNPEKAVKVVKKTIKNLKNGEIPIDKLVIRKTLSKSISKYESRQAHVHAAEKAEKEGIEVGPGKKISFVVTTKGGKSIGERSFPIEMFKSYKNGTLTMENGRKIPIDIDYYIENQVIPATSRVLNYFGYTENDLKGEPSQKKLGEF
ncbi:DNA-directed DNA polymerase [Methanonatronarchaeum sp. AMET-Sl]|uniref:DNA-directed DNA polymerase n=1 Tax=Methanonatronarchaeum sp. AMET-Sl TaxID=3037654 RepID=UPI00244D9CF6|nr:DNA-directed DNA polymerase [Methanonatronarchaeum sp. AMET-Sl]WGI18170.1 DNA-directed DNA polymerase [Methanonatronarchaeum sp. AMET-Sl]